MLGAYISVDRDQLVAVPISNAELQSRSLQIQVMQGRLLPPKTEAFIALLCRQLDELLADRPRPGRSTPRNEKTPRRAHCVRLLPLEGVFFILGRPGDEKTPRRAHCACCPRGAFHLGAARR